MTPAQRRRFIEQRTGKRAGKRVCDEENPFLAEDEEGEINLRCGAPMLHKGQHEDARDVVPRLGGAP